MMSKVKVLIGFAICFIFSATLYIFIKGYQSEPDKLSFPPSATPETPRYNDEIKDSESPSIENRSGLGENVKISDNSFQLTKDLIFRFLNSIESGNKEAYNQYRSELLLLGNELENHIILFFSKECFHEKHYQLIILLLEVATNASEDLFIKLLEVVENPYIISKIIDKLGYLSSDKSIPAIEHTLFARMDERSIVESCLNALGAIGGPRALDALNEALYCPLLERFSEGISLALIQMGTKEAGESLIREWKRRVDTEDMASTYRAYSLIKHLPRIENRIYEDLIWNFIRDRQDSDLNKDASLKVICLSVMINTQDESKLKFAIEILKEILKNGKYAKLREQALFMLGDMEGEQIGDILISEFEKESDPIKKTNIALSLASNRNIIVKKESVQYKYYEAEREDLKLALGGIYLRCVNKLDATAEEVYMFSRNYLSKRNLDPIRTLLALNNLKELKKKGKMIDVSTALYICGLYDKLIREKDLHMNIIDLLQIAREYSDDEDIENLLLKIIQNKELNIQIREESLAILLGNLNMKAGKTEEIICTVGGETGDDLFVFAHGICRSGRKDIAGMILERIHDKNDKKMVWSIFKCKWDDIEAPK